MARICFSFEHWRRRVIPPALLGCLSIIIIALLYVVILPMLHSSTISITVLAPLYDIDVTAVPEKSAGNIAFTLKVYPTDSDALVEERQFTVNENGVAEDVGLFYAEAGTYRLLLTSVSHLTRRIGPVNLADGVSVDFTGGGNTKLHAGDVNGDNTVSSDDVVQITNSLRSDNSQMDLTQDGIVNGIDLTVAVSNLGMSGDEL